MKKIVNVTVLRGLVANLVLVGIIVVAIGLDPIGFSAGW